MNEYEKKHIEMLRDGLSECAVLLKKDGKFPLDGTCDIALYGGGARHTIKGGTGSGEVNSRYSVSVEEGLIDAGFQVTTGEWLDAYDKILEKARVDFLKEIKRKARENHISAIIQGMGAVMREPEYDLPLNAGGDACVYVVSRISGEGNDRNTVKGDVLLTDSEVRDIAILSEKFEKFMLVLNVGGPVDLTPVKSVGNILVLSQLGVETGAALADIVLGRTNPSGHLTTTWAALNDYQQIGNFGEYDDTDYKEGIFVGYRYMDVEGKKPIFPFGFGLSYTEFEIYHKDTTMWHDEVTVKAEIKNTGNRAGKEVLQVYVSAPDGKLIKPVKELCGFDKTGLMSPGGCEDLSVRFKMRDFASYDEERSSYILEPGDYLVSIGDSSDKTKVVAVVNIPSEIITCKAKNLLGDPGFEDWIPESKPQMTIPPEAKRLFLDVNEVETIEYIYDDPAVDIDSVIDSLTDEELCYMNCGSFRENSTILNVIGDAAQTVAGAAGETCTKFKDKGIPSIVMADGPAGVRISREYYEDSKGIHSVGISMPETMVDLLPGPARFIMKQSAKPKKGCEIKEQYTTAIPIGTAIAQSFNVRFAEMCGDIVGDEMIRFRVPLWLAPALNIHRSILCGRNFEYYSEDPVISGQFAAAITNGVQKHRGCGVTIKHFAANNQEWNRYNNNSRVSERAMREIYLKGFDIAVQESKPRAVMTSYNLLNGTHTSEHKGLTEILRKEFGFDGIVMTDWVVGGDFTSKSTKYLPPDPAKVAAAGSDLFMPGTKQDKDKMLSGLKAGKVSREQLKINATRVYRMAQELKR